MEKLLPRQERKALARAKYRKTGKAKDAFQPILNEVHPSGLCRMQRRAQIGRGLKGKGLVGAHAAKTRCGNKRGQKYERDLRAGIVAPRMPRHP